jgi:hypothetical protein
MWLAGYELVYHGQRREVEHAVRLLFLQINYESAHVSFLLLYTTDTSAQLTYEGTLSTVL